MKKWIAAGLIPAFLSAAACQLPPTKFVNGKPLLKAEGDTAVVKSRAGKEIRGEFLFCDESSIVLLLRAESGLPSEIKEVAYSEIESFRVDAFVNRAWLGYVLGFQFLPAVLLGIAASGDHGPGGKTFGLALAPGLVTGLLFYLGQPRRPEVRDGVTFEKAKKLRKYARYPYTPEAELKQKILDSLRKGS